MKQVVKNFRRGIDLSLLIDWHSKSDSLIDDDNLYVDRRSSTFYFPIFPSFCISIRICSGIVGKRGYPIISNYPMKLSIIGETSRAQHTIGITRYIRIFKSKLLAHIPLNISDMRLSDRVQLIFILNVLKISLLHTEQYHSISKKSDYSIYFLSFK